MAIVTHAHRTRTPIGVLACLGLLAALLSQPAAADSAGSESVHQVGSVAVTVQADPFSVSLRRDGRPLGRIEGAPTGRRGGLHYQLDGDWFAANGVREVEVSGDSLVVTATTGGADVALHLDDIDDERLALSVVGPAGSTGVGLTMPIASAGHWYGGGETKTQPWPMDDGGSFEFTAPWPNDLTFWYANKGGNRPWATSDNGWDVQSPFWYSSSGLGIFIDTYDWLNFAFNGVGDGLFLLGYPHGSTLDATLYTTDNARAVFDAFQVDRGPRSPLPAEALPMLEAPIWTTWAEFKANITQEMVLQFAHDIVDRDLPRSIMEIDDQWNLTQAGWGEMEFDPRRFPDPKAMVDELHDLGFLVTLWIPPFLQFTNPTGAEAVARGYCVTTPGGAPYPVKWWNNFHTGSCLLDISNPAAADWWAEKLVSLQERYDIDGFKFDGGEANFMPDEAVTYGNIKANEYGDIYMAWAAEHGFDLHEMRAAWLAQEQGRIVREFDKDTKWGLDNGMHAVITEALALSAIGYLYHMPDMIGGNQYGGTLQDAELMARWIELSAFMSMMQFSIRPWTTSSHPTFTDETLAIAQRYADVFVALAPYRELLVDRAGQTGTPIIEPLFFEHPDDEMAHTINDQWLLGPDVLAAPVVTKGAVTRDVYLPEGRWRSLWDGGAGEVIDGPVLLTDVPAPIDTTPAYYRVDGEFSDLLGQIAGEIAG